MVRARKKKIRVFLSALIDYHPSGGFYHNFVGTLFYSRCGGGPRRSQTSQLRVPCPGLTRSTRADKAFGFVCKCSQ